jgi:hypothetical protein
MTYKVTKTYTRPSTSIPFYQHNEQSQNYIVRTYDHTGKRIKLVVEGDPNGLTKIAVTEWVNEEAYNDFLSDPEVIAMTDDVVAYQTANNITTDITAVLI